MTPLFRGGRDSTARTPLCAAAARLDRRQGRILEEVLAGGADPLSAKASLRYTADGAPVGRRT
ncbi:hypothetical protein ABZV67_32845 [Streptomyces sp. NPDC005065]|uniref:hypothetical protein n=1 Tax=Streptomyces sp. NPDC005065 TaxID=3154461 RepID=UPI0033BF25B9